MAVKNHSLDYLAASKLPLGEFIKTYFNKSLPKEAIDNSLKIQALMMVLDEKYKEKIPDQKARSESLKGKINDPEKLAAEVKQELGGQFDTKMKAAQDTLAQGNGPGGDHKAVPPFGTILTHDNLGYVTKNIKNAAAIAQLSLRMAALAKGADPKAFPEAKAGDGDHSKLKGVTSEFNNLREKLAQPGADKPDMAAANVRAQHYLGVAEALLHPAKGNPTRNPRTRDSVVVIRGLNEGVAKDTPSLRESAVPPSAPPSAAPVSNPPPSPPRRSP